MHSIKANVANLQERVGLVESSAGIKGAPPPAGGTGAGDASVARASVPGTDVRTDPTNRSKPPAEPAAEEDVRNTAAEEQAKAGKDGAKTGDGSTGQTPRDGPKGKRKTPRDKPGGTRSRVSQGSKGDQGTKSRGRRPSRVSKQDAEGAGSQALSDRASLQSSALPGLGDSDHVENK